MTCHTARAWIGGSRGQWFGEPLHRAETRLRRLGVLWYLVHVPVLTCQRMKDPNTRSRNGVLACRNRKKAFVPSSANFMINLGGMDFIVGPNHGTCLVMRHMKPPFWKTLVISTSKSSLPRLLYVLFRTNSHVISRVRALRAAPSLMIVPLAANCEILSHSVSTSRTTMSWREATFVLEKKEFNGTRRALWSS